MIVSIDRHGNVIVSIDMAMCISIISYSLPPNNPKRDELGPLVMMILILMIMLAMVVMVMVIAIR